MILDDLDSRPGSSTSLLRTVVGAHLRGIGGWVSAADLVELLGAVGVSPAGARSAVSRVKAKGLLLAEEAGGRAGYRLAPDAVGMLERGDRRIFTYRQQADDGGWCLVSFSLPEAQRDARHQLRRHLGWIGCGTVATGLWICPAHLVDEVEGILERLGLRDAATVFVAGRPRVAGSFADAAARWWDLDRLAAMHREFLARHGPEGDGTPGDVRAAGEGPTSGPRPGGSARPGEARADEGTTSGTDLRDAFARYVRVLDDWRLVPYLDPGLPPSALPADWPGYRSVAVFRALADELAGPAEEYVRGVVGGR